MRRKTGCRIGGIQPEMVIALMIIEPILEGYGQELTMTEGTGGMHSNTSRHYSGFAVDVRTWKLQEDETEEACAAELRDALGKEYVVVVHDTHLHVQFNGLPV